MSSKSLLIRFSLMAFMFSSGGSMVSAAEKTVTHTITIEGMKFTPQSIAVNSGDTIIWVNKDIFPHTATAEKTFDSGLIAAGASWRYTVKRKGTIPYICTFHPTMKGALTVK